MASHTSSFERTVFRLSGIPSRITTHDELKALLASASRAIPADSLIIYSLAKTPIPWRDYKVATLMFNEAPPSLSKSTTDLSGWLIIVNLADETHELVLDSHFWGMTPLNDVQDGPHLADCIAISGLASHAFGSWQPRGKDKTFMWIRDQVPKDVPGIRALLYGYDSSLYKSKSFQGIDDLAMGLIAHMKAIDADESTKPLIVLAHSLGGIVFKKACCMLANLEQNQPQRRIISRLRGAIMFGVPNLGMEQNHLLTLVGRQHVQHMVQHLSKVSGTSGYLDAVEQSFSGIALIENIRFVWAYEMEETSTFDDQTKEMNGKPAILVDSSSATCYRVTDPKKTADVLPIKGDHSTMVKFIRDDHRAVPIINHLRHFCELKGGVQNPQEESISLPKRPTLRAAQGMAPEPNIHNSKRHQIQELLKSLFCSELEIRQAQIVDRFSETFEWVFEHRPLTSWLSADEGMFWINGKPGSGKSTLMKFLLTDQNIQNYAPDFRQPGEEIIAGFFFNYRGTPLQKSLDGLWQNVLYQVLKQLSSTDFAESILDHLLAKIPSLTRDKDPRADGIPRRDEIQQRDENPWTRERIKEALRVILNQDRVHLSIRFYFDALDEFDGRPENIIHFLKYLVERRPESLTKTKVCFSSRPWEIFIDSFGGGPRLTIEDFTKKDIHNYCNSTLASTLDNSTFVRPLADEIANRASGVFLWANLITSMVAEEHRQDPQELIDPLLKLIKKLPSELKEYYDYIIERIPRNARLQTYALLETLIRAQHSHEFGLIYLYKTTLISHCQTYSDCQQILEQFDDINATELAAQAKQQVLYWGGGLVSTTSIEAADIMVLTDSSEKANGVIVQLMHQTVHEFVVRLDFRDRLLTEASRTIVDNGHSFHFKYALLSSFPSGPSRWLSSLALKKYDLGQKQCRYTMNHGWQAERTTGKRWKTLLHSIPMELIKDSRFFILEAESKIFSHFGLAMCCGLRLYLEDQVGQDPTHFASTEYPDPLLSIIAHQLTGYHGITTPEMRSILLDMVNFILTRGYDVSKEPSVFPWFQKFYWDWQYLELSDNTGVSTVSNPGVSVASFPDAFSLLLLKHGQPTKMTISIDKQKCLPIHSAMPLTAVWLLDHGADVNTLSQNGHTPLDYAFERLKSRQEFKDDEDFFQLGVKLLEILLLRGGKASKISQRQWQDDLNILQYQGYVFGMPTYPGRVSRSIRFRSWLRQALHIRRIQPVFPINQDSAMLARRLGFSQPFP